MDRKTIIIKKYENRRLYESVNSRYVNLEEVAELVKQGHEVRVVDAASGEDLTRLVLTQIIMEDAKEPGSMFPLDILRQMVAASGRTQQNALQYMKAMFDVYQNAYRAMTPPVTPFDFMSMAGTRPAQAAAPAASPAVGTTEVDELKRRVAEMESLIARLSGGKKAAK